MQGLGPKIDTRSEGGYVVWDAPDYSVVEDRHPEPLPAWVLPAIAVRKSHKPTQADEEDVPHNIARAKAYLTTRASAVEGEGGNDHTYKTAAALRDLGVSAETALTLLETWNERCDPPWEADELRAIVEHAWKYGQNEPGAQAVAGEPTERFADVRTLEPAHSRYHLWSVSEALTRPPPEWLFPGILPARSVGIAYGPQETGKTWLCLDQALHLATGINGYGREQSDPQDVIYFAGEGFEDLVHARIDAWCTYRNHAPARLERFYLLENFPNVGDDNDVDALVNEIAKCKLHPRLIVLDTYSRVLAQAGLNENDPLDVMKFVSQAEDLKRGFGCTVMGIHHSGKDLERAARGSNALIAAVDFAYEITANWDVRALQLRCAKMKSAKHFDPLHFEAVPQGESLAIRGITPEAYRALTTVEDALSSAKVGAALVKLGAYGDGDPVTDYVLASALHTAGVSDPEQEIEAARSRIARKLHAMARGRLEPYHIAEGWKCPE